MRNGPVDLNRLFTNTPVKPTKKRQQTKPAVKAESAPKVPSETGLDPSSFVIKTPETKPKETEVAKADAPITIEAKEAPKVEGHSKGSSVETMHGKAIVTDNGTLMMGGDSEQLQTIKQQMELDRKKTQLQRKGIAELTNHAMRSSFEAAGLPIPKELMTPAELHADLRKAAHAKHQETYMRIITS